MGILILAGLAGPAQAADATPTPGEAPCVPLGEVVEKSSVILVDGGDATSTLALAAASLACEKTAPGTLAQLWVVSGAAKLLSGDAASAAPFFAAFSDPARDDPAPAAVPRDA